MDKNNFVLVTGGAGYIGSHACKALSQAGYTPVVFDNLMYGHEWAVRWGPFEKGDVADKERLKEVFVKYSPIGVMHFAAYAYVGESMQDPGKYYRNNVVGTLSLLEVMRDHDIDKIIFSSTCATYGVPNKVPIREEAEQRPINPYGASKLMVERMLADFDIAHGIRSIVLRYFNAAGADPGGEIGESHDPETHLIPLVLDVAQKQGEHVTIFGNDYDTKDGTCVRDYIHVTDLADAHVLALESLRAGKGSDAFNIGNGAGYSVNEVIETARKVTGTKVPFVVGERRLGDPACLIADSEKIKKTLGWEPKLGSLEEIIGTAWEWHKKKK